MALLSSFEPLTAKEVETLWREGLFVFDTSFLLDLHRYRDSVREDFLKAIGTLKDQIWIPFHVAIEYEANRAKVISEKRRAIEKSKSKAASIADEVKGRLGEMGAFRRHSHIDAEELVRKIKSATDEFCDSLDKLSAETPDVMDHDLVREKIGVLFSGRIGKPPESQGDVKVLDEMANNRFALGYPPGYLDQSKEESRDFPAFSYGGLTYQKKNGDFYVWDQIKREVSVEKPLAVCFVTADEKEDWWWIIDSEGKKRLGPRPELREELQRECGIEIFQMYRPDSFVEALSQYRHIGLEPDTITEARELSQERRLLKSGAGPFGHRARQGVERWCKSISSTGKVFQAGEFPDFVELDDDDAIVRGFEVIPVIAPTLDVEQRIERRLFDIQKFLSTNPAADLRLIFVFKDAATAKAQTSRVKAFDELPVGVTRCVGYMAGGLYRHIQCFMDVEISDRATFS